ncbi:hypothetical protein NKR23_g5858 [Pleurostoma richardsiae]|uniref:Uncharacterized protein n=1 Tax=Pleurostoma richardsiae TaxID=41990 RepID=A0AA38RRU9_9PEZI|nr:hypothetical protein NKR23_g5858 [Pleurostoma richardsiae]
MGSGARNAVVFVNVSHPDDIRDRAVQTDIRRHVMRDIGKSRRRRRRPTIVPLELVEDQPSNEQEKPPAVYGGEIKQSSPAIHSLGPGCCLPLEPDSRTLELFHFMCADGDYNQRPFRLVWIGMALSDAGAFSLSLAYAVAFMNQLRRRDACFLDFGDDAESAGYYSRALTHLARQLGDHAARVSEGAIATVLGFICQDANAGNWDRWAVHMNGLEHMWRLRGGFEGLGNNIPLITVWLDLVGAVVFDLRPRFPLPQEMDGAATLPHEVKEISPALRLLCVRLLELSPQLGPAVRALHLTSSVAAVANLNSQAPLFWKGDVGLVKMTGPAFHHLLFMPKFDVAARRGAHDVPVAVLVVEMARLACLLLLVGLKARFSMPVPEMRPLRERFDNLLAIEPAGWTWEFRGLQLWSLVTAALLRPSQERRHLVGEIRRLTRAQGLAQHHDAIQMAREILWIDDLESCETESLSQELTLSHASCLAEEQREKFDAYKTQEDIPLPTLDDTTLISWSPSATLPDYDQDV